ncbi:MAG: FAD-binding oxidoreductase [Planctomycetota bacterium]|nr:MAG: FAD-binding oxidoreductase [Planctomycetota bacterium]
MAEPELLAPAGSEEAADLVRAAAAAGRTLLPCGRRTRLRRHAPEARPEAWLSLAGLDRIESIDTEDQTCVVGAGVSPEELAAAAGERGLELGALFPPTGGTLGGAFLAPEVSLLSGFFGPPRDQVLSADWLLADGSRVRTGARVVKSVAGYDLTRLFLGSRGRLAACLRLVLRLRPRPRRPLWCAGPEATAAELPAPRLLFRPPNAAEAIALLEGVPEPGADGWHPIEADVGEAARDALLAAFAAAPGRICLPPARLRKTAGLDPTASGADLLGGQAPLAADRLEAWRRRPPADAVVLPRARSSPWLARLQAACAPGAPPFGGSSR